MIKVEIQRKIRIGWFEMEIFKHLVSTRRFLATDIFADVTFDPMRAPDENPGSTRARLGDAAGDRMRGEDALTFNFVLIFG